LELYGSVCGELRKLCPRPVPPSLRLARLSVLAGFDPLLVAGLFSADATAVEDLLVRLRVLLKGASEGKCSVCGKKRAAGPWEFWSYLVEPREGRGVAVLERVAPACRRCMEALSFDPSSMDRKKWKDIVKWVSKVNNVSKEKVEELLHTLLDEYKLVAERTREWSIDVSALADQGIDHVLAKVILEKLVGEMFDIRGSYFVVRNIKLEASILPIIEEDLNTFCGGVVDASVLAARALRKGLSPQWDSLEAYIDYLREANICSKPLEKAGAYIQGAWVAVLRREQRAAAMKALMGRMAEEELVWTLRVETPYMAVDKPEVRAFSPSVFSLDIVATVAQELASALREAGLKIVRLSFRPQTPSGDLLPYPLYTYATA